MARPLPRQGGKHRNRLRRKGDERVGGVDCRKDRQEHRKGVVMSNVRDIAEARRIRAQRAQAEQAAAAALGGPMHVYRHVAALLYSFYVAEGETDKARMLGDSFVNDLSTRVQLPGRLVPDLDRVLGVKNYLQAMKKVREYADQEEA